MAKKIIITFLVDDFVKEKDIHTVIDFGTSEMFIETYDVTIKTEKLEPNEIVKVIRILDQE